MGMIKIKKEVNKKMKKMTVYIEYDDEITSYGEIVGKIRYIKGVYSAI